MVQIRRYFAHVTIGALVSIALPAPFHVSAKEPKQILVLHSFGREFKPWSEYAKAIRLELERQSPWPLDIQEHALVTARSSDENPEAAFVDYLHALHAKRKPDLIVEHRRAGGRICATSPRPPISFRSNGSDNCRPAPPAILEASSERRRGAGCHRLLCSDQQHSSGLAGYQPRCNCGRKLSYRKVLEGSHCRGEQTA